MIKKLIQRINWNLLCIHMAASLVLVAALTIYADLNAWQILGWMMILSFATALGDVVYYAFQSARRHELI